MFGISFKNIIYLIIIVFAYFFVVYNFNKAPSKEHFEGEDEELVPLTNETVKVAKEIKSIPVDNAMYDKLKTNLKALKETINQEVDIMITDLTNARQTGKEEEDEETKTSPPITDDDIIQEDKLTFDKYKAKNQEINAYEEDDEDIEETFVDREESCKYEGVTSPYCLNCKAY